MTVYYLQRISCTALFLSLLFFTLQLQGQGTYPVRPTIEANRLDNDVQLLGALGDRLVYLDEIDNDPKLWVSDGTASGTFQIGVAEQTSIRLIAKTDDAWYFAEEIADTYHISELTPGSDVLTSLYSTDEYIIFTVPWNEDIYFTVDSDINFGGDDLVKLNPETATTEILFTSDFGGIRGLGATDNEVMFIASMDEGKMLGKTDGTLANTETFHMLYEPGSDFSNGVFMQSDGEKMYFGYHPSSNPFNLWVSDGTSAGTLLLQAYDAPAFGQPTNPFAFLDGKFYFVLREAGAPSGTTFELHVTDGTVEGTMNLNPFDDDYLHPRQLTVYNGLVYFNSLRFNWALRATDGTVEGTETIISAYGYQSGGIGSVFDMGLYNDSLVLQAYSNATGSELYISDGSLEGTRLLADVIPGETGSNARQFVQVGELLFFVGNVDSQPYLWVYDPGFIEISCADFMLDSLIITQASGVSLGAIEILVSGGTPPYTYQLDSGPMSNTPLFDFLLPDTYTVIAVDANGCGIIVEAVVEMESGILETDVVETFRVFPNPLTSSTFLLEMQLQSSVAALQIDVYDLTGKRVFRQPGIRPTGNTLSHPVTLPTLAPGFYTVVVSSERAPLAVEKLLVPPTRQ